MPPSRLKRFFLPRPDKRFLIRLLFVTLAAYLLFAHVLIPLRIQGGSMEPTYANGSLAFCWRPTYLFTEPQRFDVVTVRFSGKRVMLLKRVVALAGDTVEFRKGVLYINGAPQEEPYVRYRSQWDLAPRRVAQDHVYVVGDNRATPLSAHRFGQVHLERVIGGVIP